MPSKNYKNSTIDAKRGSVGNFVGVGATSSSLDNRNATIKKTKRDNYNGDFGAKQYIM